ncbi:hypothetical protein ACFXPX_13500 [Kitasatospora sp. NPDC059146]|uniref:hypothetical protein n=1 Tax=Kitasatospora sp. NPDC059146 TaxID=3346741 RepID=UPI0036BE3E9A
MSPTVQIPQQIRRRLAPVVRTLAPLLDASALDQDGGLLAGLTCRATVEAARRGITAPNAVYVAWDVRYCCRYVGSVCRPSVTAVGDRLAEHHQHLTEGTARRSGWALLTVLPIRADAPPEIVHAAEGWAARYLAPLEGRAHPRIDFMQPPATLAASLTA